MSVLIPAANKLNADTAGLTSLHSEPPTEQAGTLANTVGQFFHGAAGDLDYLWGGDHIVPVGTPVEKPSGALGGRLGGLVPLHLLSGTQPGPEAAQAPTALVEQGKSLLERARKALGV